MKHQARTTVQKRTYRHKIFHSEFVIGRVVKGKDRSRMVQPQKLFDLPTIHVEIPSEPSSPVSTLSYESFEFSEQKTAESTPSKNALNLVQQLSPTKSYSSAASACRICHEGDSIGPLSSPCECKGTIALVHNCCLEKWLTTANSAQCEVCQYTFRVNKTPPPPSRWLNERNMRTLYVDIMCLLLFTPGGLVISLLCTRAALSYLSQGKWEGLGLLLVTAMLVFSFTVWIYFTIRYHLQNFYEWRESNPDVHLLPSRFRLSNRSQASARNLEAV